MCCSFVIVVGAAFHISQVLLLLQTVMSREPRKLSCTAECRLSLMLRMSAKFKAASVTFGPWEFHYECTFHRLTQQLSLLLCFPVLPTTLTVVSCGAELVYGLVEGFNCAAGFYCFNLSLVTNLSAKRAGLG